MCLLVKELVEAYPEAKVIYSTRDPVKWRQSIESTVLMIEKWRVWKYVALVSPECRAFLNFFAVINRSMDGWSIEALARHDRGVRNVVPKDKLFEFKLGQDGWKELCAFLELPQPEGDFPNTNDSNAFVAAHIALINIWLFQALGRATVRMAPLIVLGAGLWYARRFMYM